MIPSQLEQPGVMEYHDNLMCYHHAFFAFRASLHTMIDNHTLTLTLALPRVI